MRTPRSRSQAVLKERGSKFIGLLIPADSEPEASKQLEKVRNEFHDSTHICYAHRILGNVTDSVVEEQSDGGEPPGTAGMPILLRLRHADIVNCLLAVVRYFGGIKLGKGGLARAYSKCASLAIENADVKEVIPLARFRLEVPIRMVGFVENVASRFGGVVISREYGETSALSVELPMEKKDGFREALSSSTSGQISILELRESD